MQMFASAYKLFKGVWELGWLKAFRFVNLHIKFLAFCANNSGIIEVNAVRCLNWSYSIN